MRHNGIHREGYNCIWRCEALEADSGNKWTIPFGGGAGKIVRFGKLPVNLSAQAYWNVKKPDFGADWQLRLVATMMFPK